MERMCRPLDALAGTADRIKEEKTNGKHESKTDLY